MLQCIEQENLNLQIYEDSACKIASKFNLNWWEMLARLKHGAQIKPFFVSSINKSAETKEEQSRVQRTSLLRGLNLSLLTPESKIMAIKAFLSSSECLSRTVVGSFAC